MTGTGLRHAVGRLVHRPVATIRPADTLREAARTMTADGVGLLVVVDARGVHGVISERDVVRAAADELDLDEERVRDHATEELVSVPDTASVIEAAKRMSEAEVRHIAVSDRGEVTGIVSVRDAMTVLLNALEVEATSD